MSRELSIGMITGFITLAWMTLGYSLNWDQSEMGKYAPIISLLILIGGIYITILQKRDKDKGGIISFKEAWFAGVAVSFVVGIMSGAYMAVYVKYVNPGMVNEVIKTATDFYKSQKDS